MINGYNGETVALFTPAFKNHALTAIINGNRLCGIIEPGATKSSFTFGGRNIRDILDESDAVYFVKVSVPAYDVNNGAVDLSPLDLMDDIA